MKLCFLAILLLSYTNNVWASCNSRMSAGDTCKMKIDKLRPTQMGVGWFDVQEKTNKLESLNPDDLKEYFKKDKNHVKVVIGPGGKFYIIDRHHLARAAQLAGIDSLRIQVAANYSHMSEHKFWLKMKAKKWVFPIDSEGIRRNISDLPKQVKKMEDAPYRSLAYVMRELGAFEKSNTPFAEFYWGEYFRKEGIVLDRKRQNLNHILDQAWALSKSSKAQKLPGYIGNSIGSRGRVRGGISCDKFFEYLD